MRRKCEVRTAPTDSAKLITSQGFLRGICPVSVDGGSAAGEGARGRILAARRGSRVPTIARCDDATPGNSACFSWADAEAGTHVGALPEGRSPNTGGAAEAPRTDPDNIDSTA